MSLFFFFSAHTDISPYVHTLTLHYALPIYRDKGRGAFEQVVRIGQQRIDAGRWPILFPEGTRIAPGKVGRYKLGGALLATRTNTPIIPVAHNAGECWRRKALDRKSTRLNSSH